LNDSLAQTLLKLTDLHSQDPAAYKNVLGYMSTTKAAEWSVKSNSSAAEQTVLSAFTEAHRITQAIRGKMREMGTLSGVPIEPIEQTNLLDVCISQPGVVGGGVPGAGGYDALWLLVCEPAVEIIENVWSTYTELDVSPLSAVESMAKGARIEQLDKIPGLKAAVTF